MWLLSIWDIGKRVKADTSSYLLFRDRKKSNYKYSKVLYNVGL